MTDTAKCATCGGEGFFALGGITCPRCNGTGNNPDCKPPADPVGVSEEQRIRNDDAGWSQGYIAADPKGIIAQRRTLLAMLDAARATIERLTVIEKLYGEACEAAYDRGSLIATIAARDAQLAQMRNALELARPYILFLRTCNPGVSEPVSQTLVALDTALGGDHGA